MNEPTVFQNDLIKTEAGTPSIAKKGSLLLRLIRAAQPITRTEIANRLEIDKSTVTENVKPLISAGILREETLEVSGQGRKPRVLSFATDKDYFIGVNLGVRTSQVGMTTLKGEISDEDDFTTPPKAEDALEMARERIDDLIEANSGKICRVIGVSIPGLTDAERRKLVYAPNLDWRDVDITKALQPNENVRVVVENDATAAAMYEARLKIRDSNGEGLMTNFVLVRSGTGIGVGLVIGSEVYRGSGLGRGVAGEFGHMTIVAGGKACVCGNRGCWERYASEPGAVSLYTGERAASAGAPAKAGERRAQSALRRVGGYLGVGIGNVMTGLGLSRVVVSGRISAGWEFVR